MVSKINGKAFQHSSFFFINKKRNGKNFIVKLIQKVHNFTVVPTCNVICTPCSICSEPSPP